jgi:hypothetical protein
VSDVAAGTTSIGRLACTYALPREVEEQTAWRWRLDRVVRERLADALATALAPLDGADPGAVWIVRTLRADAVVSAAGDDPDLLARQWGSQLAAEIIAVLRRGPGGNVVRFGSRAEYVAAFVAALAEGRADTWVFEPLSGLRLLAPATAARVGAESAGVRVADVVAELVALRRVDTVLSVSSHLQTAALWAACAAESTEGRAPAAEELVERVLAAGATALALSAAEPPAARALRLLAAAAPLVGCGGDVIAAVDAIVRRQGEAATRWRHRRRDPGGALQIEQRRRENAAADSSRAGRSPSTAPAPDDETFFAAGAPAFLVLPALAAVGLAGTTAGVRALVLGRLLGCPIDDAVLLAAGAGADDLDEAPCESQALPRALVAALAADARVDGHWLVADVVEHRDGARRVALLRDAATDEWLAGAVVDRDDGVPWIALIDGVAEALGRRPVGVVGEHQGVPAAPDVDEECAAAVARLRPAAPDIAWLAPVDDDDLALGLAARAGLRHLARRLLAFERASMAYLVERFLPPGGVVTVTADAVLVELRPAPLGVVLVMAGLDTVSYRVPWLDREVVVTHRAA